MKNKTKYCCEDLKYYSISKCGIHGNKCPDLPIRKYTSNWGIPHQDGISYIVIKYCPWCGSKF